MRRFFSILTAFGLVAFVSACGGADEPAAEVETQPEVEPAPMMSVSIVEPAEGATVGPDVRVVLETAGVEIVAITPPVPGTGHHHLYVDADLTALNEMIPQGNAQIIHKGDGSAEHVIEGLGAGPHRIIAVVANPAHIPLNPPVADTVNFTVSN